MSDRVGDILTGVSMTYDRSAVIDTSFSKKNEHKQSILRDDVEGRRYHKLLGIPAVHEHICLQG